jgi:GTP-binding protein
VEKRGGAWVVTGQRVERLAARTDGSNIEAIRRFETMLRKLRVLKGLEEAGVAEGDTVRIGDVELIWGQAIKREPARRRP